MAEKTVPHGQNENPVISREITRNPEHYVTPVVDIFETSEGLTVVADLPGVERDGLEVKVDEGILTIEGKTHMEPKGTPVSREFEPVNFFRQFELPDMVDQEKIGAELKHGVLTVTLPKVEKEKPKKISIQIA
jgi:HSP20 family molecular chaperone IbpA